MVSSQKARGVWAGQDFSQPCLQVHGLKVLGAAATSADDEVGTGDPPDLMKLLSSGMGEQIPTSCCLSPCPRKV